MSAAFPYTKLPNVLADFWLADLHPTETHLLLYVLRRTVGWGVESQRITFDELERGRPGKNGEPLDRGTGLSRPCIKETLEILVAAGLLLRDEVRGPRQKLIAASYRLNLDWDWKRDAPRLAAARAEIRRPRAPLSPPAPEVVSEVNHPVVSGVPQQVVKIANQQVVSDVYQPWLTPLTTSRHESPRAKEPFEDRYEEPPPTTMSSVPMILASVGWKEGEMVVVGGDGDREREGGEEWPFPPDPKERLEALTGCKGGEVRGRAPAAPEGVPKPTAEEVEASVELLMDALEEHGISEVTAIELAERYPHDWIAGWLPEALTGNSPVGLLKFKLKSGPPPPKKGGLGADGSSGSSRGKSAQKSDEIAAAAYAATRAYQREMQEGTWDWTPGADWLALKASLASSPGAPREGRR